MGIQRIWAAGIAALLVVPALSAPAGAGPKEREPIKGSFDATGAPGPYMATDDCSGDVQPVTHDVKVPAAGMLEVTMDQFRGDWDIWVNTSKELYAAGAYDGQEVTEEGTEHFSYVVDKPTTLTLVACPYAGGPTAHVEYVYRFGDFSDLFEGPEALLQDRLPVNYVFVGFDRSDVYKRFEKQLPKTYRPVVRSRSWTINDREVLPIEHAFDHDVTFTDRSWEDRFFEWLAEKARPRSGTTTYQNSYNTSGANRVTIDETSVISAAATERWLAMNPPPGVNTSEYTAYFIDWYGRKDFQFHVYDKLGEPDTDAKVDYGVSDQHLIVAWGGSARTDQEDPMPSDRRVWFYDMSAGPDWRTGNWDVANETGYRILPSWEYHEEGARSPLSLGTDLGLLARYVAIDLLFTPSPLYPPSLTPPALPTSVNLDLNTYNDDMRGGGGVNGKEVLQEVSELIPSTKFTVTKSQKLPFATTDAGRCFVPYMGVMAAGRQGAWPAYTAPSCYPEQTNYTSLANLFLHNAMHIDETKDKTTADYSAMAFNYAYPGGVGPGFTGLADDNNRDGTQSFIYTVSTSTGLLPGMTDTTIHEYGHHFGVSHPHDGYDWENSEPFGASGKTYFAWAGDESSTVMNYLSFNNDFSQFNIDNMDRWLTASYLDQARTIGKLLPADARTSLGRAVDPTVERSIRKFRSFDWDSALMAARSVYEEAVAAARRAGVEIPADYAGWVIQQEGQQRSALAPSDYIDFIGPHRAGWSQG